MGAVNQSGCCNLHCIYDPGFIDAYYCKAKYYDNCGYYYHYEYTPTYNICGEAACPDQKSCNKEYEIYGITFLILLILVIALSCGRVATRRRRENAARARNLNEQEEEQVRIANGLPYHEEVGRNCAD